MKAGPKREITARALSFAALPASGGDRVIAFVQQYIRVTSGKGARQKMQLRPWQQEIIRGLFDDPRPRQGLISIARGNGKTSLAAALCVYALFCDREESPQVLAVASDERQAGILFQRCRRMVELEPRLATRCQVFQDKIVVPATDGVLRPLPAEPSALLGWDPSMVVVDELAVVNQRVWESVSGAAGKREHSLTLAISTPPDNMESVMYGLAEHGREGGDPSFYFREFAAPAGCRIDDEEAWMVGNPALGDFLAIDAMRAVRRTMRESTFRRQRLGQSIFGDESWLSTEQWKAAADPERRIADDEEVCLGFDGSYARDATALVAISCVRPHHLQVVELWERQPEDGPEWRVPVSEVEARIRACARRWRVRAIACDPSWWAQSMQTLSAEGLPMVEFRPSAAATMVTATERFHTAIVEGELTHSGDVRLSRHVANAVLRMTPSGPRLTKETKQSARHIDAAIASVMALHQAALTPPEPEVLIAYGSAW